MWKCPKCGYTYDDLGFTMIEPPKCQGTHKGRPPHSWVQMKKRG